MKHLTLQKQLESLKPPRLHQITKPILQAYFENSWTLNEVLFSSIQSDETFFLSPDPLRNPLIFYFGHTAAFYINKLKLAGLIKESVHQEWDHLFAVGVDPNLPQNLEVSAYWPTVDEVRAYRNSIYNIIHEVIDQIDFNNCSFDPSSPLWAIMMGLEHDRIHFETSSVLIRQLNVNLVEKPSSWKYGVTLGAAPKNEWIEIKGGTVTIGKPENSNIFGWDNEYGKLTVEVQPFKATKNLITNEEFWNFVAEGGHKDESLWTKEGRKWKTRTNTSLPKFWVENEGDYNYRAMFDVMNMPLDWPVEVNAHEAQAYCAWKKDGSRLLTEAEFELISLEEKQDDYDPAYSDHFNLDMTFGSPTPVGYLKKGISPSGFNDLYGNVWDWLQNDFYPLPGFKVHPLYKDFSEPYMDKDHGMMAGGSWITTGTGASKYYRLWFRRHFFQHAGFRLAMG